MTSKFPGLVDSLLQIGLVVKLIPVTIGNASVFVNIIDKIGFGTVLGQCSKISPLKPFKVLRDSVLLEGCHL